MLTSSRCGEPFAAAPSSGTGNIQNDQPRLFSSRKAGGGVTSQDATGWLVQQQRRQKSGDCVDDDDYGAGDAAGGGELAMMAMKRPLSNRDANTTTEASPSSGSSSSQHDYTVQQQQPQQQQHGDRDVECSPITAEVVRYPSESRSAQVECTREGQQGLGRATATERALASLQRSEPPWWAQHNGLRDTKLFPGGDRDRGGDLVIEDDDVIANGRVLATRTSFAPPEPIADWGRACEVALSFGGTAPTTYGRAGDEETVRMLASPVSSGSLTTWGSAARGRGHKRAFSSSENITSDLNHPPPTAIAVAYARASVSPATRRETWECLSLRSLFDEEVALCSSSEASSEEGVQDEEVYVPVSPITTLVGLRNPGHGSCENQGAG